jgi:hypothetical protein
MSRFVADAIGLGLDDPAGDRSFGQIVNQRFSDKELRQGDGIGGQVRAKDRLNSAVPRRVPGGRTGVGGQGTSEMDRASRPFGVSTTRIDTACP